MVSQILLVVISSFLYFTFAEDEIVTCGSVVKLLNIPTVSCVNT